MRYSRQEILIGKRNQEILGNSRIAVVGLGALGSTSSELLVRSGVKKLILFDRDIVELTDLQRQGLFMENDIGKSKALQARKYLKKINKDVIINAYFDHLDYKNIDLIKSDLVLDCTDNLETRFLINEFCAKNKIPWIYASAVGTRGYVFNVIPGKVCFRCVFKESFGLETCETAGILNTITNLISSVQVNEAFKILFNKDYEKKLLFFNVQENKIEKIKVKKNLRCPVCNNKFEYLSGKGKDIVSSCGRFHFVIRGKYNFNLVKKRLKKLGIVDFGLVFKIKDLTVFKDKVLIKAKSEKEARSLYSKYIGD